MLELTQPASGPDAFVTERCLACGRSLELRPAEHGSLRCGDCRRADRPLDRELVGAWRASGAAI